MKKNKKNKNEIEQKKKETKKQEDFTSVKYDSFEVFLEKENKIIDKPINRSTMETFTEDSRSKSSKKRKEGTNDLLAKIEFFEDSKKSGLIGQDHAVKLVADSFKRAFLNISVKNKKPLGSFIFCGPTGVGKTELVKRLTLSLFGKLDNLTRFDMSEYMEDHSVSKLIGTPPGYVGYDAPAALSVIKKHPNNVILFDEIEKAHPKILDIFLQILDEGFIKDSKGEFILFNKTIIILTSNLGSREIFNFFESKKNKIVTEEEFSTFSENIKSTLMKKLRPELVNRFDDIVVFKPLNKDSSRQILENLLNEKKVSMRQEKKILLIIEESVISFLLDKGYSIVFGAREIIRTVQHYFENPLVNFLIKKKIKASTKLRVFLDSKNSVLDFAVS